MIRSAGRHILLTTLLIAMAMLEAGSPGVADGSASGVLCTRAHNLLQQAHRPGQTRVRDYNPARLDAVFEAYNKCRQSYRTDPFVLFFSAQGMGFVAELEGLWAYAYADGLLDPAAIKLRSMPKAATFYAIERRRAVAMLAIAVKAYRDAVGIYDSADSRYWSLDRALARATKALSEAKALPASLPVDAHDKRSGAPADGLLLPPASQVAPTTLPSVSPTNLLTTPTPSPLPRNIYGSS